MASPAAVGASVFVVAFAADLLSKQWAVSHGNYLIFSKKPAELPLRLFASLLTIAAAFLLARFAAWRNLGRSQWGLSIGCGLLIAGILANGVSPLLWDRGVPDFIRVGGGWFWNFADFEIVVGGIGGLLSVAMVAVLAYASGKVPEPKRRSAEPLANHDAN